MSNDDILGDGIPPDQEEAMRQFCYQSLKLPGTVDYISFFFLSFFLGEF